jgi:hypothetical protein
MSTDDWIIGLYIRVDEIMRDEPKHPQAGLHPSEIVTLGLRFALKGLGQRPVYRWLRDNYRTWFPGLPERTRLFRRFAAHRDWTERVLADPTVLGVADTYGIERIHPWREGRSERQIGRKGLSNHRWIVGVKLGYLVNQLGLIVAWDCAPANVHDSVFQPLIADFADEMVVLTDMQFHAKEGDAANLKPCKRGTWNTRMVVETVLSMLTTTCRAKKLSHRTWPQVLARLSFLMALFNVLVLWDGLPVDDAKNIHLSIAQFTL